MLFDVPAAARLPNTAAEITIWLGEDSVRKIQGILEWHGGAAVACAMERVADLVVEERGPAFFALINEMQRWRKDAGHWPLVKYVRWKRGR